jgi:hypothetical protein
MSELIKIDLGDEEFIEVQETEPGAFTIVNENMTAKGGNWVTDATALGLMFWDKEVVDLDAGQTDSSQCFNISAELQWNDVNITVDVIKAPSIERLKEALTHVTFGAWCAGDI